LHFSSIVNGQGLFRLVDAPDEFKGDLVLKVYCEMREEEDAFLDNLHVSLQHKFILKGRVNILQKLCLLVVLQRSFLGLRFLLFYIVLHLVAELPCEVIMVFHLQNGCLVLLELEVFLLNFIDGQTDDVDHVSEDGRSNHLNHRHYDGLCKVVGS
jgi:hypothetical protein